MTDPGNRLPVKNGGQQYSPESLGLLSILPFRTFSLLAFVKPHVLRQIYKKAKGADERRRVQWSGQEASRYLVQLVLLNRGL